MWYFIYYLSFSSCLVRSFCLLNFKLVSETSFIENDRFKYTMEIFYWIKIIHQIRCSAKFKLKSHLIFEQNSVIILFWKTQTPKLIAKITLIVPYIFICKWKERGVKSTTYVRLRVICEVNACLEILQLAFLSKQTSLQFKTLDLISLHKIKLFWTWKKNKNEEKWIEKDTVWI